MKYVLWVVVGVSFFLLSTQSIVNAKQEKLDWCHCEPNGRCETLNLPFQALEQAGHVGVTGNILHAEDHISACEAVTPQPTPLVSLSVQSILTLPSITPRLRVSNTPTLSVIPTPSVVLSPTRSVTPTSEVSKSPEATQSPTQGQILGAEETLTPCRPGVCGYK